MDKAEAIVLLNKYYVYGLSQEEIINLIRAYCIDRGKSAEITNQLISALPMLIMHIQSMVETIVDWYAKKYNLIIVNVVQDEQLKPIKVI